MGILRGRRPHRPGSLGRLKALRKERFLSQHDLAEKAGVSTMTINRAENGRLLTTETAYKIADALGVDLGEMMTGEEA